MTPLITISVPTDIPAVAWTSPRSGHSYSRRPGRVVLLVLALCCLLAASFYDYTTALRSKPPRKGFQLSGPQKRKSDKPAKVPELSEAHRQRFSEIERSTLRGLQDVLFRLGAAFGALSASEVVSVALTGPNAFTLQLIPTLIHIKNIVVFAFMAYSFIIASRAFSRLVSYPDTELSPVQLVRGLRSLTRGLRGLVVPILLGAFSHITAALNHFHHGALIPTWTDSPEVSSLLSEAETHAAVLAVCGLLWQTKYAGFAQTEFAEADAFSIYSIVSKNLRDISDPNRREPQSVISHYDDKAGALT